jgi:hypothetical protein
MGLGILASVKWCDTLVMLRGRDVVVGLRNRDHSDAGMQDLENSKRFDRTKQKYVD